MVARWFRDLEGEYTNSSQYCRSSSSRLHLLSTTVSNYRQGLKKTFKSPVQTAFWKIARLSLFSMLVSSEPKMSVVSIKTYFLSNFCATPCRSATFWKPRRLSNHPDTHASFSAFWAS